ncbi:DUF7882 family protein [Subtercola sp. YIM 133946]|uniref:DUF7882 family protein n=1 Tax=Subtercola sp. YIM 133946 TaxID=3118909 RepID=UPI002F92AEFF
MGTLIYGSPGAEIEFDDRALMHLRSVVIAKLRREEKFTFTWDDTLTGTTKTLWCHPAIPMQFVVAAGEDLPLNRAWLQELTLSANSGPGLRLVPEPDSAPPESRHPARAQ